MANPSHPAGIRKRAQRLAGEHRSFERTFFKLLGRARSGTWRELDEVWDRFVADMKSHFEFEETAIFPAYAEQGEKARALVQRLRAEHDEFRRTLEELGVQLQLHEVPTAAVRKLVERLREHAELESLSIYPGAEDAIRPEHR